MKNLIPKPVSATLTEGAFELTANTQIFVDPASHELLFIGQYLADHLNPATGFWNSGKGWERHVFTQEYLPDHGRCGCRLGRRRL